MVPSVLLVSLPWTTLDQPSPGLGLLRAVLDGQRIPCRVLHLNLFLLQHLRTSTYRALSQVYALNDFLFSGTLDPAVTNRQQRWLRQKVRELLESGLIDQHQFGGSEGLVATLLHLRSAILPTWLEGWADEIARYEATLVGFTCMFDQTIASLALARLVRERSRKMLALGGYAVRPPTGEMILRSHPWIDAVCNGEGEVTIVKLASAAAGEIPLSEVPGITFRATSGELVATPPPPLVDLDANPTPNYDDFFADIRRLSEEHLVDVKSPSIPIENSRGCWWGAKSHCVFCGIRDEDIVYRARDAGKVLETMAEFEGRYGRDVFCFCDYIMPIEYFATLLPDLVHRGRPYYLSAEMKANITEDRFILLARAGFGEVQLGIESFSSNVLRKMRKGVSAVQNVYSLVLGRRLGVKVLYNLLYGFPDDDPAEYDRMASRLPHLIHLDQPVTCVPVQITRFSPLQMHSSRFGIDQAHPEPCYDLVFSRDYLEQTRFDISAYCYYFARPFENAPRLQRTYERILMICAHWRKVYVKGSAWLYREDDGDGLIIHDGRLGQEEVYRLGPSQSRILVQCERPTSLRTLLDANPFLPRVDRLVAELEALGLLFRDETRVVSIVLPEPTPQSNDRNTRRASSSSSRSLRHSARCLCKDRLSTARDTSR